MARTKKIDDEIRTAFTLVFDDGPTIVGTCTLLVSTTYTQAGDQWLAGIPGLNVVLDEDLPEGMRSRSGRLTVEKGAEQIGRNTWAVFVSDLRRLVVSGD